MAFILVTVPGSNPAESLNKVEDIRQEFTRYMNGPAIGNINADGVVRLPNDPNYIGKFDTRLDPPIH